jgi:hypothetical protein
MITRSWRQKAGSDRRTKMRKSSASNVGVSTGGPGTQAGVVEGVGSVIADDRFGRKPQYAAMLTGVRSEVEVHSKVRLF